MKVFNAVVSFKIENKFSKDNFENEILRLCVQNFSFSSDNCFCILFFWDTWEILEFYLLHLKLAVRAFNLKKKSKIFFNLCFCIQITFRRRIFFNLIILKKYTIFIKIVEIFYTLCFFIGVLFVESTERCA